MTATTFIPHVVGLPDHRHLAQAALAVARSNPGTPVLFDERPRESAVTQRTMFARLDALRKSAAGTGLSVWTRVEDGAVRGYIEYTAPAAPPVITHNSPSANPAVFDITYFTPSQPEQKRTARKARRAKSGRPAAGEKSRSERYLDRILEKDGKVLTLTSRKFADWTGEGTFEDFVTEKTRELETHRGTLRVLAARRGHTVATKIRTTKTRNAVYLSAKLVVS